MVSSSIDTRNIKRRWPMRTLGGAMAAIIAGAAINAQPARADAGAEAPRAPDIGGDIMVTAQRREQSILTVPLSITSYSRERMDRQGIRQIDDIARLTPSLRFTRTAGVTGNNGANISIRGIASDVGAATTAIYIDDTPIQIRSVGYFPGNPYPRIFDLERVEVLRGPQGTLFGAGAEGGAVRFLTPRPGFGDFNIYARSEISATEHGAESHEAGIAAGGRVSETIAVRFSAWHRRDGGYIDRIDPATGAGLAKDIDGQDSHAARFALSWRPVQALTITPAIFYQNIASDARSQSWEGPGVIDRKDQVTGRVNADPSNDRFYLPSIRMDYDFGRIALISNTSYFDRRQERQLDFNNYLSFLRSGSPFGTYNNKQASNAIASLGLHQRNLTEEVRLQSFDNRIVDWAIGGYYARTKQYSTYYSGSGLIPGVPSRGVEQYLGRYNLYEQIDANDRQIAAFANIDVKPIADVTITIGGRYTRNRFDFRNTRVGPVNSGKLTAIDFHRKEDAFTPKFGATWRIDPNNMLYASAGKGFRQGGAQPIVDKLFCAADIAALGVTDSPSDYKSDSLWSYEAGVKNSLFGGRLILDANAYVIKWSGIQQAIRLPGCGFTFVGNLGDTTSRGTDIQAQFTPARGVQFGGSIGYNRTTFDKDAYFDGDRNDANPGVIVRRKGQRVGGPSWTGTAFIQLDQPVNDRLDVYGRFDYSFAGDGIATPPGVFGYDAGLPALDGVDYSTIRIGARFSGLDLSAFVNNVTDQDKPLSRNHDGVGSPLYYLETYRPRTIGVTMQYRY